MNMAGGRAVETVKMKFLRYVAGYSHKNQVCSGNI
jgi:hypothetical protein